jgi:hypothetical protein
VRVGALAADLLEPRRRRQNDVGEAACGIVQEEVEAHQQIRAPESLRDAARVRVRRKHVRTEEDEHADVTGHERLRDARHLARAVAA